MLQKNFDSSFESGGKKMPTESAAIRELEEAALDLETELGKLDRRIALAQEQRQALVRKLSAINEAMAVLRQRLGLPETETQSDNELREKFRVLDTREMAIEFARMRGGKIIVQQAAQVLANMGLFKDARNAASNLYTAIGRSIERNENVFSRVRRGEYELLESYRDAEDLSAVEAKISEIFQQRTA